MTTYPPTFFDSTPNYISQFVLACLAQEIADTYFINNLKSSIDTNYAQDAVTVGISADNTDNGVFTINVRLPLLQKTPLLNSVDLAERVVGMTSCDLGRLSIPRESAYAPRAAYLVPSLPTYLVGDKDILERRVAWLGLGIVNLKSWVEEWNNFAFVCRWFKTFLGTTLTESSLASFVRVALKGIFKIPFFNLDSTVLLDDVSAVSAYTDYLIAQLNSPLAYRSIGASDLSGEYSDIAASSGSSPTERLESQYPQPEPTVSGVDISGTTSEQNFYDPGNSSNSSTPDYSSDNGSNNQPSLNNVPNVEPENSLPDC